MVDYEHTACGILVDDPVAPNTKFRCFDGEAYQECDMLHEYTFLQPTIPFCLPGYFGGRSDLNGDKTIIKKLE